VHREREHHAGAVDAVERVDDEAVALAELDLDPRGETAQGHQIRDAPAAVDGEPSQVSVLWPDRERGQVGGIDGERLQRLGLRLRSRGGQDCTGDDGASHARVCRHRGGHRPTFSAARSSTRSGGFFGSLAGCVR